MTEPDGRTEEPNPLTGRLHAYVAFDWGEEVDLEAAGRLAPGAAVALSRRPRTPTSFAFRPPPLRFTLGPSSPNDSPFCLPGGAGLSPQTVEATVFDFAAVSVAFQVPFTLTPADLLVLAGHLADPAVSSRVVEAARSALLPLYRKILPAIERPAWSESLWEEYFVFQLPPGRPLEPDTVRDQKGWLAGLVRLEDQPLSADEVAEAVRLSLSYGEHDLFVPDWAAAFLLDYELEADETLQTIEFANLQLLEYRHIDDRLDTILTRAYGLIHRAARRRLPWWKSHDAPLRVLGELKVEANGVFERTGNVLKLVGDQYLARIYRLLAARFHLREWQRSIERKLEVIEGTYKVIADQTAEIRTEFLELVVIGLILVEILLAIFRH
jgi:hypothetical protein